MAHELIAAIKAGEIAKAKQLIETSEDLTTLVNEKDEDGNTALHWAAKQGNAEIITLIFKKFEDKKITELEFANDYGNTPLHSAARFGHLAAVEALLESSFFEPNERNNKRKTTPLRDAAVNNQVEVIKLLLDKGADVNAQDNEGRTSLHEAALQGSFEAVRILLVRGANASLKTEAGQTALDCAKNQDRSDVRSLFTENTLNLNKQLLAAAEAGNAQQVAALLASGADVNYQGVNGGYTALLFAINANSEVIVRQLLAAGANVNLANNGLVTPVHAAAKTGNVNIVNLLLEKGADPNLLSWAGTSALHQAAFAGKVETAKALLNSRYKEVNLSIKNTAHETALDVARRLNNPELVKLLEEKLTELNRLLLNTAAMGRADEVEALLAQGAEINYKGTRSSTDNPTYQYTALHYAAMSKNIATMIKLLALRADIEATSYNGMTALYYAIDFSKEAVELVLSHHAKVNINSFSGLSPLHFAIINNKNEAVDVLLQHGANVNALDKEGNTPLHSAVYFGQLETVRKLLERGANIHIKNSQGQTALEIAKAVLATNQHKQQFEQIAQLIETTAAKQKKAKAIQGLKLVALLGLSAVAAGGLVIGIGALAGWSIMVSLLSFAPWLAMALPAAITGIAVIGLLAYGIHRFIAHKQKQVKTLGGLAHEEKQRLLDDSSNKKDEVQQVLGTGSSYTNPLASSSNNSASSSKSTTFNLNEHK